MKLFCALLLSLFVTCSTFSAEFAESKVSVPGAIVAVGFNDVSLQDLSSNDSLDKLTALEKETGNNGYKAIKSLSGGVFRKLEKAATEKDDNVASKLLFIDEIVNGKASEGAVQQLEKVKTYLTNPNDQNAVLNVQNVILDYVGTDLEQRSTILSKVRANLDTVLSSIVAQMKK